MKTGYVICIVVVLVASRRCRRDKYRCCNEGECKKKFEALSTLIAAIIELSSDCTLLRELFQSLRSNPFCIRVRYSVDAVSY